MEEAERAAMTDVVDGEIESLRATVAELRQRLDLMERRNLALLDAVRLGAEAVVVVDTDGALLWQSGFGPLVRRGHLSSNDAIGETVNDVIDIAISGRPTSKTLEILGPPHRSLSVTGFPVTDLARHPAGAVVIMEDTSDYRHRDAVRRDFVANVSHELKTPIGALGLLAETLLIETDPEVANRLIRRMHTESLRVGQVVDDLLNLSRIESAAMEMTETPFRVVIDTAMNRVRYAAEHRAIAINVHGDLDASLYGGARELVSAVQHLIENALKYSNDRSHVDVVATADGDWTQIDVTDHGVGIAPQYLDRIFERFYRVDDARTRYTGGTGLGLSIVRRVVHNHGGEVRVSSKEGEGSTFTLLLPARPSAAEERVVEGGTDG